MPLSFQEWLDSYGAARLAKELNVTDRVVERWYRGNGWPRIKTILELIHKSNGKLSLQSIIDTTWPAKKRGRK